MQKLFKTLGLASVLSVAVVTASPLENHLRSDHYKEFGLAPITFDEMLKDCEIRTIGKQCYKTGLYFIEKRKEVDTGLDFLNKACTVGYSKSCRVIGDYYAHGEIVSFNPKTAREFYDAGCRKGSTLSCQRYNNFSTPTDFLQSK